jgi:hypothetical protein
MGVSRASLDSEKRRQNREIIEKIGKIRQNIKHAHGDGLFAVSSLAVSGGDLERGRDGGELLSRS